MFNKKIKGLFVRDDTQSMKLSKDMKKRGVKSNGGCVYYEYTYQDLVDGIVPCICGEIAPKDIYSRSTYSETHTKNDHVDGRCLKCADRENWKECFNYLKSTHAEIVHTHSDVLKHTNIMKMLGNESGEIKCICGKVYPISHFHVSIFPTFTMYNAIYFFLICIMIISGTVSSYNPITHINGIWYL